MEIKSTGTNNIFVSICAQCREVYTVEPHICSAVEHLEITPTFHGPVFNNNELAIIQKLERVIELLKRVVHGS